MFSQGPLTFDLSVKPLGPAGTPTITAKTTGGLLIIRIKNSSTLAQDVDLSGSIANGLLVFPAGGPGPVYNIPPKTPVNPWYVVNVDLARSANPRTGSETVSCASLRYRANGAGAWGRWQFPPGGNAVIVDAA